MLRNCQVSVASLGAVAVLALLRRQQLQARALGSRILIDDLGSEFWT